MECLNKIRATMNLGTGLEAIGRTRFGTTYWSADSLRRNMPAMQALVLDDTFKVDIAVSAMLLRLTYVHKSL